MTRYCEITLRKVFLINKTPSLISIDYVLENIDWIFLRLKTTENYPKVKIWSLNVIIVDAQFNFVKLELVDVAVTVELFWIVQLAKTAESIILMKYKKSLISVPNFITWRTGKTNFYLWSTF